MLWARTMRSLRPSDRASCLSASRLRGIQTELLVEQNASVDFEPELDRHCMGCDDAVVVIGPLYLTEHSLAMIACGVQPA